MFIDINGPWGGNRLTLEAWIKKSTVGLIVILFSSNAFGQVEYGSIMHDGLEREYIMYVPSSSGPNGPLVFSLHGYKSPAEDHMNYTFMKEVADTAGFIVVYPKAIDDAWNSGFRLPTPNVDDVGFISALIDTLQADYAIDLDRIYVFGFSQGGQMTMRLACELNDRFAKAASVSSFLGSTTTASCNSAFPIPMLFMHGTADPVVSYQTVEETMDHWLAINGCVLPADSIRLPDIDPLDAGYIDVFIYQNCTENSSVVLYKMYGGGHTWPGWSEEWEFFFRNGPTNRDIIADVELWKFFNSDIFSISIADEGEAIPVDYALAQNYPNPFNPVTTIRYALPKSSKVTLMIYNLMGQEVARLVDGKQSAGNHNVTWNASNISSGIYFYRLRAGDFVQTRKMVLLK